MRDHEVRGSLQEGPVVGRAWRGQQVEVDADVDAAVPVVAVGHPAPPEPGQQGVEFPEVGAQSLGWHGGIFPTGPPLGTGHSR